MNRANVERLHLLLKGHEEMLEEKRIHPELLQRQGAEFREVFKGVVRAVVVPTLTEVKDLLVGRVESAAIFHGPATAGLKVKLDRWEDHERSLLFFADAGTRMVRVTHDGVGFGLLSRRATAAEVTPALVEEEAMKFLKRLFADEQLRRPAAYARRPNGHPGALGLYGARPEPELIRL